MACRDPLLCLRLCCLPSWLPGSPSFASLVLLFLRSVWWRIPADCRPRDTATVEAAGCPLGAASWVFGCSAWEASCQGRMGTFPPESAICIQDLPSLKRSVCFTSVGIEPSEYFFFFLNVTTTEAWVSHGELACTHVGNALSPSVVSRDSWKWLLRALNSTCPSFCLFEGVLNGPPQGITAFG